MQKINFEIGFAPMVVIVVAIVAVVGIGAVVWLNFEPGESRPPMASATPDPNAPNRTSDLPSAMLAMTAQNNSGLDAKYQLIAVGSPTGISSQTKVIVNVSNATRGVSMPAHIHVGSCANLGAVKYPLNSVVNGASVTTLNASIAELKFALPLAINIHKSVAESGVYVACADLNADSSLDALFNSPARQ